MNIHEVGRGGVMVRKLESQEKPFSKNILLLFRNLGKSSQSLYIVYCFSLLSLCINEILDYRQWWICE